MGDKRDDAPRGGDATSGGGVREFASSALLLGAVAAILLTGLALRSEPAREREIREPEPAAPATSVPAPAAPAALPQVQAATPPPSAAVTAPPSADPALAVLAGRAAEDLTRIGRAHGSWTAQLVVACKPETVDRLVRQSRGASKLYVLPAEVHGAPCFRVCWGSYASASEAASAKDLPAPLRGAEGVRAVLVAKVLP
jgi:septal ring-binding cell division protein DamX